MAVSLGLWQMDSWQAQRDAQARDLTLRAPVPLAELMGPDDPFPAAEVGQPVLVTGTWVPEGTVYVTDRTQDGVDGSWAVTPVAVGGETDAPALLVVRGFLDDPEPDPATAPEPPAGEAEILAWLQPAEGTGATDPDPSDDLLPQLRLADAIQHVEQDLYSGYAVAIGPDAVREAVDAGATGWPEADASVEAVDGLSQATLDALPKSDQSTGLRNLLYAVEWWMFAAFAVYIWWRYVRDEIEKSARGDSPGDGPSEDDRGDEDQPSPGSATTQVDPVPSRS